MHDAKCKICGIWHIPERGHRCPPVWKVWSPELFAETEDDAKEVYAPFAEEAVEKWAERMNWEETGCISDGTRGQVFVKGSDGCIHNFLLRADTEISYNVNRIFAEGESDDA